MEHFSFRIPALLVLAFALASCAHPSGGGGWATLIDGETGFDNWNRIGDANWRSEGGAVVADKGKASRTASIRPDRSRSSTGPE